MRALLRCRLANALLLVLPIVAGTSRGVLSQEPATIMPTAEVILEPMPTVEDPWFAPLERLPPIDRELSAEGTHYEPWRAFETQAAFAQPLFEQPPLTGDATPPATPLLEDADEDSIVERLNELERRLTEYDAREREAALEADEQDSSLFSVIVFGRIQADAVWFDQSTASRAAVGPVRDGVDFRRARLGMMGDGFDIFFYRLEVDFALQDLDTRERPVITDCYLDTLDLPFAGTLRAGRFREPASLELLGSTNDQLFMERALSDTFTPVRNNGVETFRTLFDERMTTYTAVTKDNVNAFGEGTGNTGEWCFTQRLTWLPWYDEPSEGRYLLHVGGSYSFRDADEHQTRFRNVPEIRMQQGPNTLQPFVDTGFIPSDNYQVVGLEALSIWGPLSFQTEYHSALVNQIGGPNLYFDGYYVAGSFLLTGENRGYDREIGTYTALIPYENFFRVAGDRDIIMGKGAWELTARYSSLDLDSQNVSGGQLDDITLGLNWYFALRTRWMFNYIHSRLLQNGAYSAVDIFGVRFQVVW